MSIPVWLVSYGVNTAFWLWVIFWGGAEWFEGRFASGLLISVFAPNWSAEGIKIFAWLTVVISTIAFVVRLFS
jgi:hypothetical protein